MLRGFLLSATALLALSVPAAQPAAASQRFLLALTTESSVALYQSSDGVRFAAVPGFTPASGTGPAPVRRGPTLYLYDPASLSPEGLGGTLRRFTVRAGGGLVERTPASYTARLASLDDAARATPGGLTPSLTIDDGGALVLLYALRYEPGTNACPLPGQACVKLRTATEVAGSDGTAFTGDAGNRIVLSFPPADAIGPPALFRAENGWAVAVRGPAGCLQVLAGAKPNGAYRNAGCILNGGPASPSGLWDARLREYRLYGVSGGRVVRAVTARLRPLAPGRFRPLALPGGRPSAARVVENAP